MVNRRLCFNYIIQYSQSCAGIVLSYSSLKRALKTTVDTYHVVTVTNDAFLKKARKIVDQNVRELVEVIKEAADAKKSSRCSGHSFRLSIFWRCAC